MIVRPSGLGDVILSLITISSIKRQHPDVSFGLCVIDSYRDIPSLFKDQKDNPLIDSVKPIPDFLYTNDYTGDVFKRCRLEFQQRYTQIINWMDEKIDLLGDRNVIPRVNLFLENSPFQNTWVSLEDINLQLDIDAFNKVSEYIDPSMKNIGVSLMSPSIYRSFDEDHVRKTIELLLKDGYRVVHFGRRKLEEPIEDDNFVDIGLDIKPFDLFHLISRLNLLVSVDSGPIHMASVTQVPFVGFYGNKLPELRLSHLPEDYPHLTICNRDLDCVVGECLGCPERPCLNGYSPEFILNMVRHFDESEFRK